MRNKPPQVSSDVRSPDSFTNQHVLPSGIYEDLYKSFFEHTAFKEWRGRHGHWQLRVIGPPGSGKVYNHPQSMFDRTVTNHLLNLQTTLSALTVERLNKHYKDKDVHIGIASIFVKRRASLDHYNLACSYLASILTQFSNQPEGSEQPIIHEHDLELLQRSLQDKISSLDRAFLIVDDIDLCEHTMKIVETDLQHLQSLGLKVLVTSRIPLMFQTRAYDCDSQPGCGGAEASVYWVCKECYYRDNIWNMKSAKIVCSECKISSSLCPTCKRPEYLHEPYSSIDLNLSALLCNNMKTFEEFLAFELELTHGDIGLGIKNDEIPNSKLGKDIKSTNYDSKKLITAITEKTDINIAIAKTRLSLFEEAQSVKEVDFLIKRDRLSIKFINLFEAGIARILQQSEPDRMLGLVALTLLCPPSEQTQASDCPPFGDIQDSLVERRLLEYSPDQDSCYNLSRVLRATCGLVKVDLKKELWMEPFDYRFAQFVRDDYVEEIAKARLYGVPDLLSNKSKVWDPAEVAVRGLEKRMTEYNIVEVCDEVTL